MEVRNCHDHMLALLIESMRSLGHRDDGDVELTLRQLTDGALRWIPAADHAGITVVRRGGPAETSCATDRYAAVLDDIERRCDEGPVATAAWAQSAVLVADLPSDARWPRYRRQAIEGTPVRSLMCLRLFADQKAAVVLSFHAHRAEAFDDAAVEAAAIYADFAGLAWRLLCRDEQFKSALASRDVIGQAKGMIMERYAIEAPQAFELIKRLSQNMNMPVAEIAQRLTDRTWAPSASTSL